jgi:LysM repeat protein
MKPLLFFVPTIGRKSEEKEKTFVSKRSSKEEANWAQKDRWNALRERAIDPIKRALSSASGNVSKGGQFFTKIAEEKEGKMKSGSYVSSPAKEEVPKKNKKDEDSAKRFNGFVFPLEKERKRVEERWKEVVEKMKKERMATFTSSSSSSADARKQEEQQKNKNKNADNGKEGRNSSSLMIKAKAEKMTKEVSLKLNENVSKVNAAIEARKKETEEAFTSAKRRVMAMTVKKDAERDDGKHKNKRRENNKSSTSTNSSNNNNNNNRDSENKKNKKKTATGEEPPPTNIFERSKSAASDFFGTATASMEDVKGNIDSVQKSVAKKLSDMQLRENFEGTTQNIARESKKLVTEDLPSTIKTLSKESANLTGSALKEFNENIDVDVIAQNAKKSFEGTSKTVETLIRDVHSNASLAAASGKALVTDLIDPPEKMHRVRQGESLLKIARKYDVSVVDVCRVNNLAPTDENPHFVAIKIGQVLNIPNPERMAEQPAYESSKFDEKYESTVNAYYEQRLNASSSSSKKSKVAVATSEGGGLGGGGAANIRIAESSSSSSSSGNAKLAGSFALLATAAAISYLRAGLDDDSDDDNNDSNTNNNTTIGGDENTNSQML